MVDLKKGSVYRSGTQPPVTKKHPTKNARRDAALIRQKGNGNEFQCTKTYRKTNTNPEP